MATEDYNDYLAARILSESKPVTYRLLSRAINVDVNSAKRMLFDFHKKQNAKKPNSVHATYLITGTKRTDKEGSNGIKKDGEDVTMRSSPFMSSMPEPEASQDEQVRRTTIALAREEELQQTRSQFERQSSIHIYSLQPGPIASVSILSACNYEITPDHNDGDPMDRWKVYGSIRNAHVKRRTAKFTPPAAAAKAKPTARPALATVKKEPVPAPVRRGSTSEDNTPSRSTPQPASNIASLKRSDSKSGVKKQQSAGQLFKSFAKTKPKAVETPPPAEDDAMQGMSEDEPEGEDEPEVKIDEEKVEAARKAREDRQEKLRKMMEDDDEVMPDAEVTEDSEAVTPPVPEAATPDPVEPEPTVTVEGGRRRGKRKVMKKKKVKDEDGYLVTREEAVWESFSEDEPEAKKLKPAIKAAAPSKGKPAGKKGQGSIASFFKKA